MVFPAARAGRRSLELLRTADRNAQSTQTAPVTSLALTANAEIPALALADFLPNVKCRTIFLFVHVRMNIQEILSQAVIQNHQVCISD